MNQSQAYEFLGEQIGEALSLAGVHGGPLLKIAEKLKSAQNQVRSLEQAIAALGGSRALDLRPESVLVISSDEIDEFQVRAIAAHLKTRVLILPSESNLDLAGEEHLLRLCQHILGAYPHLRSSLLPTEKSTTTASDCAHQHS